MADHLGQYAGPYDHQHTEYDPGSFHRQPEQETQDEPSAHHERHDSNESSSSSRSQGTCGDGRQSRHSLVPPLGYQLRSSRTTFRFASSNLHLASNPVVQPEGEEGDNLITDKHAKHHSTIPTIAENGEELPLQFQRRESASTSELFYDLWFVANLNVFATVHPITQMDTLVSFIGFFFLLWVTWLITTVFDARFGQDGILERIARAIHLTVMIGFAIVGVSFGDDVVLRPIFKALSMFLMASRLTLALQYGLVLYHTRHHHRTRRVLMIAIALHLMPAIVYLVAGLCVGENPSHNITLIWYGVALGEMLMIIVHATVSKTLSFEGTHFNERLNLLTLIIIGEGVIILAKNITKIVEYTYVKEISERWSPALIGIIICSAALLYLTFQLYFDWMHHHSTMKAVNQALWTCVHLPFHIALVLLSEGGSQWGIWWRAMESFREAERKLLDTVLEKSKSLDTEKTVEALKKATFKIMKDYGSTIPEGGEEAEDINETFKDLLKIPDEFWEGTLDNQSEVSQEWTDGYVTISSSVINAISEAFDIAVEEDKKDTKAVAWDQEELQAVAKTADRLLLIFVYMFLAAGLVLILLMLMHLVSKRKGWSVFNMFRTLIVFGVGLGLALVAVIATSPNMIVKFLETPWQLPLITICYFLVLILTHLPHPPRIFIKTSELDDSHLEMNRMPSQKQPTQEFDQSSIQNTQYSQSQYSRDYPDQYDHHDQQQQEPEMQQAQQEPSREQGGTQVHQTGTVQPDRKPSRAKTLRRGLTMMRNVRIEGRGYDPVADREDEMFFPPSPISGRNLYRV